jgi:hypothetical protein
MSGMIEFALEFPPPAQTDTGTAAPPVAAPVAPAWIDTATQALLAGEGDRPAPWRYCVLDIETTEGRPEDAERDLRLTFWPAATLKTEMAIGRRFLEARERKLEKLALLDSAPIAVVSLRSDEGLICLHSMRDEPICEPRFAGDEPAIVIGFQPTHGTTSPEMLAALARILDESVSTETVIVGHNILHFDLRKLRWAYVRAGIDLPVALASREQQVWDSMREFVNRFSMKGEGIMVALQDVLEEFGLGNHKKIVTGAEIPGLIAKAIAGDQATLEEVVLYALLDVVAEGDLYLRMTGQERMAAR